MGLRTRLTEKLQIEHPILSAPMAYVGGGRLAAAVCDAGGLGLIGGGYGDAEWLEEQFRAAGNSPVGCGFITWSLADAPHLLDQVLDRRPAALFLSFGDPTPFATRIADAGVPLICQTQTVEDARQALDAGASVIVAQGSEAGGHAGRRATFPLVPEVADLLARRSPDTLLCAAGGVADGRGLAAALMLGADGVVIGSRFTASEEALVAPGWQDAHLEADGDATIRTAVVDIARRRDWPDKYRVRVLGNALTDRWRGREEAMPTYQDEEAARYEKALATGDTDNYCVIVGENAGLIGSVEDARTIVQRIVEEAEHCLRGAGDYCAPA